MPTEFITAALVDTLRANIQVLLCDLESARVAIVNLTKEKEQLEAQIEYAGQQIDAYCAKQRELELALRDNERETTKRLKDRIDTQLNNCLCEMKPGYDDSIVGFNEAWDIVREILRKAEQ